MFGVIAFGFLGDSGYFQGLLWVLGWIYDCEDVARCFKGFWGIYGGFIKGLMFGLSR